MEDSQNIETNIKIEKEDISEDSIDIACKVETEEIKLDLDNREAVDFGVISQNGELQLKDRIITCKKHTSVNSKPTGKVEFDRNESLAVPTVGMEEKCQDIATNDELNAFDIKIEINSLEEISVNEHTHLETSGPSTKFETDQPFIKLEDNEIEDRSMANDLEENELNDKSISSVSLELDNPQLETAQSCNKQNEKETGSSFASEAPTIENNEANVPSFAAKFNVNRSAIETVPKENQASELQTIEGLSVYDQSTLEAGILLQVDQALEIEAPGQSLLKAALLKSNEGETEMERQIRQGEITPFGTSLGERFTSGTMKCNDGLSVIEKYFGTQLELQGQRKRKIESKKLSSGKQLPQVKTKRKEEKHDSQKSKTSNCNRKKKKRKKEIIGTDTQDFVPWSVRPDSVPGEQTYMYPDDASGSEYLPSDSDCSPSSEDEKRDKKLKEKKDKPPANKNKRKLPYTKPYKIPEDWATDDSDWEYSDEEGNLKKNKRSKKELDDGDVDVFNRRIRIWKQERKQAGVNKDSQLYHKLNEDFKLPQDMWDKLYNYQRVGVQWLWELDQQMCGGILGDEMGLGKTIQIVAFLAGLHVSDLKDKDTKYRGLGPTLIVCPTTVMHQWVREFHEWYPPIRVAILHESGTFCGKQRRRLIGNVVQAGGILITSYTGATQHKDDIISRQWHYVVLDEGHKIRNPDAQISLVVKQFKTTHRIILSGSPMQNNLKELWSLFDFVFPGKLGTLPVFLEQFAVPITQGGYANASQAQVMTAFKCATVLKDTMAPYLLRRMKADVKSHVNLPEKNEQVLFCRLTDEQRHYYKDYVESGEVSRILEGRLKIFVGLINLRKICNHPDLYVGRPNLLPGEREEDFPEEERFGHWTKSGKMIVVETLLKLWHKQGHRVLVFTQSRQMLSIMESFVRQAGYRYLKLDGTTSIAARQPLINKFNLDTSYFLMLLTTRVGGLGVNLTGANRVLIYDPDWNPATDTQARERAWRIGQRQSVTVYRLITAGTIEEKMYHRQIFKQFLCNKVLKDPRQRRFFKSNDLYELFALKETNEEGSTETGAIFAGTGSEVKLDPTKTYKHQKIDPKLSAEPPPKTFSRKTAEKKKMLEQKLKEKSEKMESTSKGKVNFSNEKIEYMKKLAQTLSQKIVQTTLPEKINPKVEINSNEKKCENFVLNDCEISNNRLDLSIPPTIDKNDYSPEIVRLETPQSKNKFQSASDDDTSPNKCTVSSSSSSNNSASLIKNVTNKTHKHKRRHKDKKSKRHKDAKFEGETVPHLVRAGESTSMPSEDKDNAEKYATQDEYVLQKLFAKSGLQTALQHDTIMEGGPSDYALVEVEADRVAQQAVEKLKESRRECWQASSGIPNFTGLNGARNFQLQKRLGKTKSSVAEWSSSAILEQIRKRNCTRQITDPEIILVRDIRDFVSSQGSTVHTTQLIDRFEGRLPEGSSPLFKSLLAKICTFYRAPDKLGYWTLKEEFNW